MTIAAATVHLDAQSGLDAAGGLSPEQAWKTLAQANKADLKPGDTLRNNLIFHAGPAWFEKNFTAAPTDILAKDPLFVNPGSCSENGDYRLKPGSPAINAGASLGYAIDLNWRTVPQGGMPDIGAYESRESATGLDGPGRSRFSDPGNLSRKGSLLREPGTRSPGKTSRLIFPIFGKGGPALTSPGIAVDARGRPGG